MREVKMEEGAAFGPRAEHQRRTLAVKQARETLVPMPGLALAQLPAYKFERVAVPPFQRSLLH